MKKQLNKLFGRHLAGFIAVSPTLASDLQALKEHHVRLRLSQGCKRYASSNAESRLITISRAGGRVYQLASIAHEKVHVIDQQHRHPDPLQCTMENFVDSKLDNEAEAEEHALIVYGELLSAGVRGRSDSRTTRYKIWRDGGFPALRKCMETTVESMTQNTYRHFLEAWWCEENGKAA